MDPLTEKPTQIRGPCTEWLSGNRSSPVQWSNTNTGNTIFHEIELQQPQQDVEINNQAQDGKAYYAMPVVSSLSGFPSS